MTSIGNFRLGCEVGMILRRLRDDRCERAQQAVWFHDIRYSRCQDIRYIGIG